ncbi:MAG TPA: DUF6600 domain-containing protein [Pyrinomonadaceae bacterium]|jgi:hypothetical protein
MWHPRPTTITRLFLLSILLAFTTATAIRADDDNSDDEYEENARVARVSLTSGDVQLRRNGNTEWETARVNFPLVEGDVLATTGADARVEIQIDARNFVRVGGDSVLRVVSLRDAGVALSLSEGVATLRLARFDHDKEYFEIDAPGTTLAAEERGVYRVDVGGDGRVRLAVRDGGRARIYSETSGFTLRDGREAELVRNGSDAGDWELNAAASFDSWDTWVDERERDLSARLRYEDRDRYYDRDVWGAEELDSYGDWTYADSYGWVWRPHTTVINNYYDWAPYRYGRWAWVPPYGWTWIGDESWGWAPYHYGRWVYYNNSWCWAPRGYGYSYKRAWWRPALVVFAYVPTSYGEQVCWYPLRHGQRDPRGLHYRRLEALGQRDLDRLHRTDPAYLRAITTLPARQFGRQAQPPRPATDELARRVVGTEPVRGRLPIGPPERGPGEQKVPRVIAGRPPTPAGGAAGPPLPDRQTGAARRTPGVPLDNELRRARLYNGREPRPSVDQIPNAGGTRNDTGRIFDRADSTDTGAVTRTPRARGGVPQPIERNGQGDGDTQTSGGRPPRPRVNTDDDGTPPNVERPPIGPPVRNADPRPEPQPRVRPRRDDDNDGGGQVVPRPEPRPEPRVEPRPEPKREPREEPRTEPRTEPRPEPRHEPRPEPRVEPRPEPKPERHVEPQPERQPEPQPERHSEPRVESRPEPRPEPPARHEESKPSPPPPQRERESQPERPSRHGGQR